MTSTEAGICAQLHVPTLTIPVDPRPGPDLTQIHINPQPSRWGCGAVRSEFGWLRWLSRGRWALAKELRNGWCKHQDCSQQFCNLQFHCFIERFTKGNGLHGSLCAVTEILRQVYPFWRQVVFLKWQIKLSLCTKGSSSDKQQAQREAAPLITHSWFFPVLHLMFTCPSWSPWSYMVWEESSDLDSLDWAQLSPRL